MKIDVDSINHNVTRLTAEILTPLYETLNDNSQDNLYRIEYLGEIKGMLMLADALKELLQQ
jgi:hypothetical protein